MALYPVPMRAAPTLTLWNPVSGSASNPIRNGNAATDHPALLFPVGSRGLWCIVNNSSVNAGEGLSTHFTADAEL